MSDLLNNQLFSGGFLLMISGAVMALLRSVPSQIWAAVKRRFTVSVTITDRDPLFEWATIWLDSLPYSKRARSLTCSLHRESDEDYSAHSRMTFSPAHGRHFFRHNGRFIWMERTSPEATGNQPTTGRAKAPEMITLTVLSTRQEAIRGLVREISQHAANDERRRVRAYVSGSGWWRRMAQFAPRAIDTVDLPLEDTERILAAIQIFLEARALYAKRGIPYHLNFLFAGLPGTGKTSIASALCGHFGLNLHLLNIAGPGINDSTLAELMLSLPRRSMVLMEDVDAVVPERKAKPAPQTKGAVANSDDAPAGVTLSGLLNCMDGLTAPDGAIIVMTTNHPELIDPALLRPGRVDIRIDFRAATYEQIQRMCARLAPAHHLNGAAQEFVEAGLTTAQVQQRLLELGN